MFGYADYYLRLSAGPHGRPEVGAFQEPVPSHHGPDDDSGRVRRQNDEEGHGGTAEPPPYTFPSRIDSSDPTLARNRKFCHPRDSLKFLFLSVTNPLNFELLPCAFNFKGVRSGV